MKIDCNPYGRELIESDTVSEALADNRIVSVEKTEDGMFEVREKCDGYFYGRLTKEQFLAWIEELQQLAVSPDEWTEVK